MPEREDDLREEMLDLVRALKGHIGQGGGGGRDDHLVLKGVKAAGGRAAPQERLDFESAGARPPSSVRTLDDVRRELGDCKRCPLHLTRRNLVFGEGNPSAGLVFIGEAPGEEEDLQGRPFVGRAGQLLTRIIEAMGFQRRDVYICNILKCRPPGNRNPKQDEMETCEPFLIGQIDAIGPKVICALGSFAARRILQTEAPITALRGKFHEFRGVRVMPTYHPAYLLRNPEAKKQVWEDVQLIMKALQ
ncbi:MAG TPA: uracil-DNA glycosylase [Syntrophales bacterium]|nr:uracil-DNA glycosylase [Syntrophales bacterium]HPN23660.1 uracil-DNA glycosylase [Syntrophales bacterium]